MTSQDFQKVRSVNCTDTAFPTKIPTLTEPTGDAGTAGGSSIIDLRLGSGTTPSEIIIVPYGIGDDDDVFAMRIIGWKPIRRDFSNVEWIPTKLLEITCTMCTDVGVVGGAIINTERYCDTLVGVGTSFNDDITIRIFSPADNTIARARVELEGFSKIEFTFDMTTGAPTNGNCLYCVV